MWINIADEWGFLNQKVNAIINIIEFKGIMNFKFLRYFKNILICLGMLFWLSIAMSYLAEEVLTPELNNTFAADILDFTGAILMVMVVVPLFISGSNNPLDCWFLTFIYWPFILIGTCLAILKLSHLAVLFMKWLSQSGKHKL